MDAQPSARGADLAGATATGARSHRGGASAAAPAPTVRCTQRGKKAQQLSQTAAKRARGQAGNRVGDAPACTTACTLMQTVGDAGEPAARPPRACAVRALAVLQIAGGSDEEGGSEYEVGGAEEMSHDSESETSEGKPHKKVKVCIEGKPPSAGGKKKAKRLRSKALSYAGKGKGSDSMPL